MIDRLRITNFKRFLNLDLRLAPLTLLTGINSGGKSSVIQALLLLHSDRLPGGAVPLNGPYGLALGEARDVLHSEAPTTIIEISILAGDDEAQLSLEVPNDRSASLIAVSDVYSENLQSLSGEDRGFIYLSAERFGPLDLQEVSTEFEDGLSVGTRGEFTAHVLSQLSRRQVDEPRLHPATGESGQIITLNAQAELWMSSIVSPLQIDAAWLPGTNAAVVRFKSPEISTDWLRPANVGFGVSYALPIVVAGLTVPAGGLLIVENPEAHLHPAGQSAMGGFLGRVAAGGSQVIIETHSDHVLAGVRRAVGVEGTLNSTDVAVHYFGGSKDPTTLDLDETGALSAWPQGFFDQTERDLAELARAKLTRLASLRRRRSDLSRSRHITGRSGDGLGQPVRSASFGTYPG